MSIDCHAQTHTPQPEKVAREREPVWGVPSNEMIHAEKDGAIILVEDFDAPGYHRNGIDN
jgi:hypothetical protein